jgi:hypothetical protein
MGLEDPDVQKVQAWGHNIKNVWVWRPITIRKYGLGRTWLRSKILRPEEP